MSVYLQLNRPMKISTPLGPEMLLVEGLSGYEALSELFEFHLDLVAPKAIPIAFDKLLAQPVTVELTLPGQTATRYYSGIVRRLIERDSDETFTHFEAIVVPKLWFATQKVQSRIFQQMSVPEILAKVLQGIELRQELSASYPARDYCVQYHESDFAFASRLMEEEGIFYYFVHSAGKHEMVIADNVLSLASIAGVPAASYEQVEGAPREAMQVTAWQKFQDVCPVKHTLWDYSFELPGQNLEAVENVPGSVKIGTVDHKLDVGTDALEVYEYPGGYAKRFDGVAPGGGDRAADLTKVFQENKRTATIRAQAAATRSVRIEGQSNGATFAAGGKFTLLRHPNTNGEYYLTRVDHQARCNPSYRSGGEEPSLEYQNCFHCLPAAMVYRPARATPKPTIAGPQTATVVGPSAGQLLVDKYGRIKVQFHWDRQGKSDADSSCWIRVGQTWAGPRWGAFFWPRAGHEVIVAFEDGDPDQPIVTGSVYNSKNMPPLELPGHAAACGFKSCSVGGDPATEYNCVVFHDSAKDEHLQVHSQKFEAVTTEAIKFDRAPSGRVQVFGSLAGSGIGGGVGSGAGGGVEEPSDDAPDVSVATTEDSGAGGGMLEWLTGVGGLAGWKPAEAIGHLFPGSSTYVFGTALNATMLGDTVNQTLAGAEVNLRVDPESLLEKIPFVDKAVWLLCGCGGINDVTLGPNVSITYSGPALNVVRGESLQYQKESFWTDWSTVGTCTKLLFLLTTGTAAAGDIMAVRGAHTQEGKTEYPEWAKLTATAVSSRMQAALFLVEKTNAHAHAALEEAQQAARRVQEATALATQIKNRLKNWAAPQLTTAKRNAKSAIDIAKSVKSKVQKASWHTQTFNDDYSLTARDVSITSRAETGSNDDTTLNLEARGAAGRNNGHLNLAASGSILLNCNGRAGMGVCQSGPTSGELAIGNTLNGTIKITQGSGSDAASPNVTLTSGESKSIVLSVGSGDNQAKLELSTDGISLKFGSKASVVLNKDGVTSAMSDNKVILAADSVTVQAGSSSSVKVESSKLALNSGSLALKSTGAYSLNCLNLDESATGTIKRTGTQAQIN